MNVSLPHISQSSFELTRTLTSQVVDFDVEKLKTYFPYWDRLHAIRKSALWQAQASYIG